MELTKFDKIPSEEKIFDLLDMGENWLKREDLRIAILPESKCVHIFYLHEIDNDEFYPSKQGLREYLRNFGYSHNILTMNGIEKVEVEL